MRLLRALMSIALAVVALTSTTSAADNEPVTRKLAGGNAACGSARVRKPWRNLTPDEKSLYLEAVATAMNNKILDTITAIHLEEMSEHQAHRSCAFLSWHRRLLLAYESALRDQDPKFACVTLPYYDVVTAYVELADKKCNNMYECAGIFEEFGGKPSGGNNNYQMLNGRGSYGAKYSGYPLDQNCDDNNECGFILRNDLTKRPVPSSAGFSNVQNMISSSKDYASMLIQLQYGLHNEIHNAVGGAMATFASPRDPFFFMWHAAIDMFLYTYHQCHIGKPLTEDDVMGSLQAFVQRSQQCGEEDNVDGQSDFVMRVNLNGEMVDISQHPTLGKYFTHVGNKQWQYADTANLGDYSYSYELGSLIRDELVNNKELCKGPGNTPTTSTPSTAPPSPAPPSPAPPSPAPPSSAPPSSDPPSSAPPRSATPTPTPSTSGSGPTSTTPTSTPAVSIVTPSSTPSTSSNATGTPTSNPTPSTSGSTPKPSPSTPKPSSKSPKTPKPFSTTKSPNTTKPYASQMDNYSYQGTSYWAWFKKTFDSLLEKFNGDKELATQQMSYIECATFDGVFGVSDFSEEFVKNFHLASNRTSCKKKVDKIESGNVTVAVNTTDFKPDTVEVATDEEIKKIEETYAPKIEGTSPPEVLVNKTSVEEAKAEATSPPPISVVSITTSPTSTPTSAPPYTVKPLCPSQ